MNTQKKLYYYTKQYYKLYYFTQFSVNMDESLQRLKSIPRILPINLPFNNINESQMTAGKMNLDQIVNWTLARLGTAFIPAAKLQIKEYQS